MCSTTLLDKCWKMRVECLGRKEMDTGCTEMVILDGWRWVYMRVLVRFWLLWVFCIAFYLCYIYLKECSFYIFPARFGLHIDAEQVREVGLEEAGKKNWLQMGWMRGFFSIEPTLLISWERRTLFFSNLFIWTLLDFFFPIDHPTGQCLSDGAFLDCRPLTRYQGDVFTLAVFFLCIPSLLVHLLFGGVWCASHIFVYSQNMQIRLRTMSSEFSQNPDKKCFDNFESILS